MLKNVKTLPTFERDLVNGYCRLNSNSYVPNVVMKLSMVYLWILDEFVSVQNKNKQNNDINNEEIECAVKVSGLNNTICKCIDGGMTTSIYGKNMLTSNTHCIYYHWRFKILNEGDFEEKDEYNFIIGIKAIGADTGYSLVGSHGLKLHGFTDTYSNKRFCRKNDILDMFLDLKNGKLSFIVNNCELGVAFDKLDISKQYRMQCALSNKNSALELISYHSSKGDININYDHDIFEYINYVHCLSDISLKIKYFEVLTNKHGIHMNGEILNGYIDCLVIKKHFDKAYGLVTETKTETGTGTETDIFSTPNLCKLGSYFYFEMNNFEKALNIFKIMGKNTKNEMIFVENHLCVEVAFCYEHSKKKENMLLAMNYYLQAIKYEKKLGGNGRNECFHHMGAIYFNSLSDYRKALNCFLKITDEEINRRNLESAIASCYDQLKQSSNALKWFKKYEIKYKNKPSVLIVIALIYYKRNNNKKAERYFNKALKLDVNKNNWMVHSKYGYYLLNGKKNYKLALAFFEKSLAISNNLHEKSESYKCMGACYDKLGDMDNAIKYTEKVLDINPNDADALNNAGYFYLTMQKYKLAYSHLIKSLKIYPCGELTTGNIGICLFEMGPTRYNEAIRFLKKAIFELKADLQHKDVGPRCLQCYAVILYEKGNSYADFEHSIQLLKQLIKHKEFNNQYKHNKDEIFYLLSRVYVKCMDFHQSLKFLKKAKKFNPNRQIYKNQIKILKNNHLSVT